MDERIIFCDVHFNQLSPAIRAPVSTNHEVPVRAGLDDRSGVAIGTRNAVAYLARKEGRARELKTAQQVAAGGAAPAATGFGSTDSSANDTSGATVNDPRYDDVRFSRYQEGVSIP